MTALVLEGLTKSYGKVAAVQQLDLSIGSGELIAFLGPSGCGKTTTLRLIAGFLAPSEGRILAGGQDVTRLQPHKRGMGMVFQSYALFPHLSVAGNIGFGLRRRGTDKVEIRRRVDEMIALLRLDGLADRLPRELSGGQQQRVAVGRAVIINPLILLLDEPFSNLDTALRESTRTELQRIQSAMKLTTIFVTHDQEEAMAISDRVAVMNNGRIEQFGSPREIYRRPQTRFVAEFIGRSNLFETIAVTTGAHQSSDGIRISPDSERDAPCLLVVRPEDISLAQSDAQGEAAPNSMLGRVESVAFLGSRTHLVVRHGQGRMLLVDGPSDYGERFAVGCPVLASWPDRAIAVVAGRPQS